jgi:alcohol dehydrogenase/L-iditol 2-dehydrogenase
MKTMPALVNFSAQPNSVELRDVPVPSPGPDDVLLRVKAVGICGSDLHQYQGKQSWKVNYPVILGHEFGGEIAETGSAVHNFKVGDRVVSETAAVLDTNSPYFRTGKYNLDPNRLGFGYGVDGAMTQYVRVPQRCLHRIPAGLAYETAALTEPCCVAYSATCVNARILPGDCVVVIGPGPIGLLCAIMARIAGANPLVVMGVPADSRRLAVARKLGATHTFDSTDIETLREIKKLGDGCGADVVVDAAGVSATLKTSIELVRPGGHIVKVGWGPQPCDFSLDPLVQKAATLQGSFSHTWPTWERVLFMMGTGQLDLSLILNRIAPLNEWKSCFDQLHEGQLVKAVLTT